MYIVGFGKAVIGMIGAVEDILGDHIQHGVASVPHSIQDALTKAGRRLVCTPWTTIQIENLYFQYLTEHPHVHPLYLARLCQFWFLQCIDIERQTGYSPLSIQFQV